MSISGIPSSALQYTSIMQSTPAASTSSGVQPSAPQSANNFQQALSNVTGSAQPAGTSQPSGAASSATSAVKPHHGGHHRGGGSSSASQASTLLSTLSSLAGPSLDISV